MIGDKRVIGIVPARAGSRRMIGKNTRLLAGRPMIGWTLAAAQGSTVLDRIVVSSDDPAVLALAEDMGCPAPFERPAALSGPEASVIDAVEHALGEVGGHWDYVVLLQPTSPLRRAQDIDAAVALAEAEGAPAVISVSPLAKPAAFHVEVGADGALAPAPEVLDRTFVINGAVYVARPDRLLRERTFRPEGTLAHVMPVERGWDVDTSDEFAACEARLTADQAREAT
ncbi:acylneuraminate cytidylyltransferase family protein [Brevundimonas sp. A19_0]|uniref:acylneuraminate cytidylyltransferase family protein n=1 Tax=Brevundimonas sp. A19_0 TaxID=2821087 RepID=UPI001ADBC4B1|nr:acylneuraminate cytidylyltransferase family protein [Brevundimonas sp. A19_0]MBO9502980.1 acylneuraminate cytidylyltransferase family protein [Brevundimonas sp. A19_0]